jgi:chorismate mutase
VGFQPHALFVFPLGPGKVIAMPVRGIRGATTASDNTRQAILDATTELIEALIRVNDLRQADIASIYVTMTPDLDAAFPAAAIRLMGWNDVALLDAQSPRIANDVPRCIRVLIHWNTQQPQVEIRHAYLRDARVLRPDRASL